GAGQVSARAGASTAPAVAPWGGVGGGVGGGGAGRRVVVPIVLLSLVAPAGADGTAPAPALRGDEILHGNVVKVEDKEIYVDLGAQRGVADGSPLRIKRAIKLRHPITRTTVEDWIPIGSAT